MSKGQLSLEAVTAVAVALLAYAAAVGLGYTLQDEAGDIIAQASLDIGCSDLAAVVDGVYSAGDGASVEFEVAAEFRVHPGLIELGTTKNTFYCLIDQNAVKETKTLTKRRYTIKNEGGWVEFN